MRSIVVLSGVAIAASLALWPSPSHPAQKGRAASPPPGKSAGSPSTAERKTKTPKMKSSLGEAERAKDWAKRKNCAESPGDAGCPMR